MSPDICKLECGLHGEERDTEDLIMGKEEEFGLRGMGIWIHIAM